MNAAVTFCFGVLAIALIGPAGFVYNLYQPLMAVASDADQKVCCVDTEARYALSPDARWLVMAKRTPNSYFGLGDKVTRAPYVAAVADLQSGRFVSWKEAAEIKLSVASDALVIPRISGSPTAGRPPF